MDINICLVLWEMNQVNFIYIMLYTSGGEQAGRGGLSDLGALNKLQVWALPHNITVSFYA